PRVLDRSDHRLLGELGLAELPVAGVAVVVVAEAVGALDLPLERGVRVPLDPAAGAHLHVVVGEVVCEVGASFFHPLTPLSRSSWPRSRCGALDESAGAAWRAASSGRRLSRLWPCRGSRKRGRGSPLCGRRRGQVSQSWLACPGGRKSS